MKYDALGDFFILQSALKNYYFEDFSFILNIKHKTIVRQFFPEIYNVIFLDKNKFLYNPIYTFFFLKKIATNYSVVNLRSTSLVYIEQLLIKITGSQKENKYFSYSLSDFQRVNQILNYYLRRKSNSVKIKPKSQNYTLISPFTSDSRRDYPLGKLLKYSQKFNSKTKVVVESIKKINNYIKAYPEVYFIESNSLKNYIELVKNANTIITNDSSAGHIGLFYNKSTHVFIGGGQPGQFFPYGDEEIDKNLTLISNNPDCSGCNWQCSFPLKNGLFKCVSEIKYQ